MAGMMDRMRERIQGQRPVGAAGGMMMRTGGNGGDSPAVPLTRNGQGRPLVPAEAVLEQMTAPETAETAEARRLGEKMGAQGLLDMLGLSSARRGELEAGGRIMNAERLNKATETLLKYKAGKASVNRRVIAAQEWWKLKNWEQIKANRGTKGATTKPSNTGWLWNSIVGKHADAIDSYPEPIILPQRQSAFPRSYRS